MGASPRIKRALCTSLVLIFVNRFKQVIVIAVAVLIAACSGDPPPKYYGFLYFGAGGYLGKFSLRDGSSSIVRGVGDANIREVDELHDSRVLLSLDAIENDREVAKIAWLDVRTFQDTTLFAGVAAVWLPEVHTYIYDDGSRLSAASTHRDFETDNVILDHRINDVTEIVPVSPSSVVFELGQDERRKIWHYDAGSAELVELDRFAEICSLQHSSWIVPRHQMACRSEVTGAYVLIGLDGEIAGTLALPEGREQQALEYIADQNLLVFVEPWRTAVFGQPRIAVWVHELDTANTHRIAKHQHLGRSTAYRRE